MNWIQNMKIGPRLLAGFAVTTMLTALVGVLGLLGMQKSMHAQDITYASGRSAMQIDDAILDLQQMQYSVDNAIVASDPAEVRSFAEIARKQGEEFSQAMNVYEKGIDMDSAKEKFAQAKKLAPEFLASELEMLRLAGNQSQTAAITKRAESRQTAEQLEALMLEMRDLEDKDLDAMDAQSDATMKTTRAGIITVLLLALLIAAATGFFLSRGISQPLNHVLEAVTHAATGDLTVRVDVKGKDEVDGMADQINVMLQSFEENMRQVAMASSATGYNSPASALPACTVKSVTMKGESPPIQPALRLWGRATAE